MGSLAVAGGRIFRFTVRGGTLHLERRGDVLARGARRRFNQAAPAAPSDPS